MADVRKTIEIVFTAVDMTGSGVSSVGGSLNGMRSGADDLAGAIGKITGPMSDLGDFALRTEAAIVALGAAMIGFAVNEASKFQAAQNEIGTLLGANAEQAGTYGKDILAYASNSTQAIDQITAATYAAISAGASQADALGVVNTAEKLAVAGKAELAATTVALVSTLNAYGASADEAARYSDVLFTTVRLGQTTIPELAASLAQVTGIAGSAGVPIETLGAAIAALTASGLPTAQSITGIKAAISAIIQPSKEAAESAASMGIEFSAAALKSKGFEGVMAEIAKATGGNVEKVASLFGSVEALNAVLSLTSNDGAKFTAALAAMQSAAGATEAAFKLMSSNGVLAFQNLQNNLKISLITAGMPLLDQFGGSVNGLANIFKSLTTAIDAGSFAPLYAALGEASKGLQVFLDGIAKALPQALAGVKFDELAKSFGDIGEAMGGIFGDLDLTKPEDLQKAIQFVVDAITGLNNVVEGIVTAWGPAINSIVAAIDKFNAMSKEAKVASGEALGFAQVFEKIVGPIISTVTGAVGGLGNAIAILAGVMGGSALVSAGSLASALGSGLMVNIGKLLPLIAGAGALGIVGALGLAGSAAVWFASKLSESAEPADKFAERMKAAKDATAELVEEFNNWTPGKKSLEEVGEASDETAAAIARLSAEAAKDLPLDQYEKQVAGLTSWERAVEKINESLEGTGQRLLATGEYVDAASGRFNKLGNEIGKASLIIDQATGAIIGYYGAFEDLSKADQEALLDQKAFGIAIKDAGTEVSKAAKEMKEAEEKTRALNLEMSKLKSAENIALIAQQTAVTSEKIKANAATMVAAFESVSASITSTNALIGDLYGKTSETDRFGFLNTELLKSADKRASELTKAQIEMLKSQAELMAAQAESAKDGGAIMKIEADGLAPHLEAFMWEILKAIQLRVNKDGMQMLLGVA